MYPQAPETAKTQRNSIGMEFVLIPAGTFQMGSNDGNDEKPVHTVRIMQPFYLGKYEVTQGQWTAAMGANPSFYTPGNFGERDLPPPLQAGDGWKQLPVDSPSWDEV